MEIFEIINGHLFPTIHCLMIEPFKSMWNNDTSEGKENCLKDFTYIELLCSPKKSNIYYKYSEEDRPGKVKQYVYGDENHGTSSEVMLAIIKYKEELSTSLGYSMLNTTINLMHTMKDYLDGLNPADTTPSGALKLKPKEIFAAAKEVPDLISKLEEARDKLHSELGTAAKTRNDREINEFER